MSRSKSRRSPMSNKMLNKRTLRAFELALGAGATGAAWAFQHRAVSRNRDLISRRQMATYPIEPPSGIKEHEIQMSDGARIYAIEAGPERPQDAAPALLLVHGVTLQARVWSPVIRPLSKHHRVVAIDVRGHGRSSVGSDGVGFSRQARDIGEVLEALDLRDAILAGHSMGGMASMTFAVEGKSSYPEQLSRVAMLDLVDTSPGLSLGLDPVLAFSSRLTRSLGSPMKGLSRSGRSLVPRGDLSWWMARFAFGANPDPLDVEATEDLLRSADPENIAGCVQAIGSFNLWPRLGEIGLPTKVIVGSRDNLTPAFVAKKMARSIPGARLEVLPGVGHMSMLEAPASLSVLLVEGFPKEAASKVGAPVSPSGSTRPVEGFPKEAASKGDDHGA
jgi:pimeloyl-ACP methyl ester carboxylesterase